MKYCWTKRPNHNLKNTQGYNPILSASRNGNTRLISLLLNNGADINCQSSKDGYSPLIISVIMANKNCVKYLIIRKGLTEVFVTATGKTALQYSTIRKPQRKLKIFWKIMTLKFLISQRHHQREIPHQIVTQIHLLTPLYISRESISSSSRQSLLYEEDFSSEVGTLKAGHNWTKRLLMLWVSFVL